MYRPLSLFLVLTLIAAWASSAGRATAQLISLNFSENSANQGFTGGELIGPLQSDSANWNNTNGQPDLANGLLSNLIDSTGAATTASVIWGSSNTWYNNDGTGSDESRMAVGYLDDGGGGVQLTFSDVPYTSYRVYGLLASDQGNNYDTLDFIVNGAEVFGAADFAPAYGNMSTSLAQTGARWSRADGATRGNYWTIDTAGSTLTISGLPRNGAQRGSLTAVIIRDLNAPLFDVAPKLTINRDTGLATLTNNTGATFSFTELELGSLDGAWSAGAWTSIAAAYDQGGAVSNDPWAETSRTASLLAEGTTGVGALAQGQTISLGAIWPGYVKEGPDVRFELVRAGTGDTVTGLVEFTGNDGDPFEVGDINLDGAINTADWSLVRNNFNTVHAGSIAAAYRLGDLTGDLRTDARDLIEFKAAFNAANGAGAFEALAAVPEPATWVLLLMGGAWAARRRRVLAFPAAALAVALVAGLALSTTARAQTGIGVNFRGGQADDEFPPGADVTGTAGVIPQGSWNNVGGNIPATDHDATVAGLLDSTGATTTASVTWSTDETWSATTYGPAGSGNADRDLVDGYLDAVATQPTATALLTGIPYAAYDVYVYVGSDGDGRTGNVRLNNSRASERWFLTSTSETTFFSAADYLPADALTEANAAPGNYVVYQDVIGPEALIGVTRGSNNVGMHGVQIVRETNPQVLRLEVNSHTGVAQIRNTTAATVNLDYFEITSASAGLNAAGWDPLGTGTVNGSDWEVLGNLDNSILAQFYLTGQGTLGPGQSLALGQVQVGQAQDLAFRYNDTDNFLRGGLVSYVTGGLRAADFNSSGVVDGADLAAWKTGFGTTNATRANGDANSDGVVNGSDFLIWQRQLGLTGSATSAAAGVPEGSSLALALIALGSRGLSRRGRRAKRWS